MCGGGGGETGRIVLVDVHLPEERTGLGLHARRTSRSCRRTGARACPFIGAATMAARTGPFAWNVHSRQPRVCAHGVHDAGGAADEDVAVDHGGLRERRDVAVEAEGPPQLQLRDLIGAEAGRGLRLKAGVAGAGTPAVPGDRRLHRQPDRAIRAERRRRRPVNASRVPR